MASLVSTGDIVELFAPTFLMRGKPGHRWRKAVVLGLEVDPYKNSIQGLWLCRLSDRAEKIRPWDSLISADEVAGEDGLLTEGEWVARTHRIDLVPSTKDFFGSKLSIAGHVVPEAMVTLRDKLDCGQSCSIYSDSLGPRPKLPHTVAKIALSSENSYDYFDYDALLTEARHAPISLSSLDHAFTLAERENTLQQSEARLALEAAFSGTQDQNGGKNKNIAASSPATSPFSKNLG